MPFWKNFRKIFGDFSLGILKNFILKKDQPILFHFILIVTGEPVELQKIYDYLEKEDILSSL